MLAPGPLFCSLECDNVLHNTLMGTRIFSSQLNEDQPPNRRIDDDAPAGLRQELIDVVFQAFERTVNYDEVRLHKIITQSLGLALAGQPYGGFRYAVGRDINKVEWRRAYDLICRLWRELPPNCGRITGQVSIEFLLATASCGTSGKMASSIVPCRA
jgi:hypothetical protein